MNPLSFRLQPHGRGAQTINLSLELSCRIYKGLEETGQQFLYDAQNRIVAPICSLQALFNIIMILDKVDLSSMASAFKLRGYSSCAPVSLSMPQHKG